MGSICKFDLLIINPNGRSGSPAAETGYMVKLTVIYAATAKNIKAQFSTPLESALS